MTKPNVDDLIQQNPKAEVEVIEGAQRLIGALQQSGVQLHTYDLESPFAERNWLPRAARPDVSQIKSRAKLTD